MVSVSIRLDDETKAGLDEMCAEMGMNLTTFFTIYAKAALREREIPFRIKAPADPFYSPENMAWIAKADEQAKEGKVVMKTMKELENIAHG